MMSPERTGMVTEPVLKGRLAAGKGQTLADFDIAPFVPIAMGSDLQACRDAFPKPVAFILWLLAEIAIIATDIAEVIGTAIGLNLLFGIPLEIGVIITALDVFLILYLQWIVNPHMWGTIHCHIFHEIIHTGHKTDHNNTKVDKTIVTVDNGKFPGFGLVSMSNGSDWNINANL